ncbi:MAG: SRPBCC domain-containing protein [Bacteroidota bacterium]
MTAHSNKKEGLKIVRHFNAPKALVFEAFSSAEAFAEWWGPTGMPVSVTHFDFRAGGKTHYKMEGNGHVMWGLFQYKNISSPDLIEFISSFSDEEGNVCKAPFPIEFPDKVFNRITLTEHKGVTTLALEGHPIDPTNEQEATYYSMTESMEQGFGGTFNQLEQYLLKRTT